jgi:UDPglucose--hexose-1-phosphate uridylyltransferase
VAQVALGDARASGSWRTVVAPPGEHRALHAVGVEMIAGLLDATRSAVADARRAARTDHLQVVQNWGAQAGARTNHLCLDLYDLPQIPHRVAEELGGAARYVIREGGCPWCRLVREEPNRPERLVWQDDDTVAFAPYASRSPFEVWIVPRRHDADFGRAGDRDIQASADALRQVLGSLSTTLDGPPYNLVLHTAPLREQVDATYHWHWEIHPRLREIAGLELGTGLPVNPVSPEDAVEELVARTRERRVTAAGASG